MANRGDGDNSEGGEMPVARSLENEIEEANGSDNEPLIAGV